MLRPLRSLSAGVLAVSACLTLVVSAVLMLTLAPSSHPGRRPPSQGAAPRQAPTHPTDTTAVPSGLQDLARDLRANSELRADPCQAVTTRALAALGLPPKPTSRSVDFVAKRCRWATGRATLEVAVGTTTDQARHEVLSPDRRAVHVRGAAGAVEVPRPITRDAIAGRTTRAVVAFRPGRSVVVELTGDQVAHLDPTVLPAIAAIALGPD